MDEYIKRSSAIEELTKDYDYLTSYGKQYVDATKSMISRIPAADVVEVKYGYWIEKEDGHHMCSECLRTRPYYETAYTVKNWICHYCHYCGAKMKEGDNDG